MASIGRSVQVRSRRRFRFAQHVGQRLGPLGIGHALVGVGGVVDAAESGHGSWGLGVGRVKVVDVFSAIFVLFDDDSGRIAWKKEKKKERVMDQEDQSFSSQRLTG